MPHCLTHLPQKLQDRFARMDGHAQNVDNPYPLFVRPNSPIIASPNSGVELRRPFSGRLLEGLNSMSSNDSWHPHACRRPGSLTAYRNPIKRPLNDATRRLRQKLIPLTGQLLIDHWPNQHLTALINDGSGSCYAGCTVPALCTAAAASARTNLRSVANMMPATGAAQ